MSRIDEAIRAKKEKRSALETKGVNLHPYSFNKQDTIAECLKKKDQSVQTAGRLMAKREHGKIIFGDLQDSTNRIQVMFREPELTANDLEILSLVDAGDFIGISGKIIITQTGEITILASSFKFLGKALRPLPSEWNAAEDKEIRYRKRYLDILINEDAKKILDVRWQVLKEIRRYLQDQHGFIEVETPIFQPLYGGTNAKPFSTHMDALNCDFYLRIAPELYLKRLMVGGYEKIFEIARNFRNEGIDQTHQPEFTMIEWYEAYTDYHHMMDVAESLIRKLTQIVHGSHQFEVAGSKIDVSQDWSRITMDESIRQYLKLNFDKLKDKEIKNIMEENHIELTGGYNRGKAQFSIFDKLVPPHLIQPTWIIDYPREISPLSKAHRDDPRLAERFEAYIGGKEIADGWSEIVDPIDQRQIFENEQTSMRAGDEEAHPLDEDFLEAMEYGLPPMGGIGVGIDRLVMFLTNTWNIKEVIPFPTLKPRLPKKNKINHNQPSINDRSLSDNNQDLPPRSQSEQLLKKWIKNPALRHHCQMVATAMEAYANKFGEDAELWYQAGLLHDLDWEAFPGEHPNKAVNEWLIAYPEELKKAILSHAPHRTNTQPDSKLEHYLFACDELSGFMHAYSLMRPTGFEGMKANKVCNKLKDASFATGVNREDVTLGFELIDEKPAEHIEFLVKIYKQLET